LNPLQKRILLKIKINSGKEAVQKNKRTEPLLKEHLIFKKENSALFKKDKRRLVEGLREKRNKCLFFL